MVRSIPQLEALRDDWDELSSRFSSPLLDHDWFMSCAETFHGEGDLRVVIVNDNSRLVAAAPLAQEHTRAGGRLMLLGASKLYEPSGWLFGSSDALSQLTDAVLALKQPLILQRIPTISPLCHALRMMPRKKAISVAGGETTTLSVPTEGSWDSYYTGLSSRVTGNLPRLRRKAEKALGPLHIFHEAPREWEVDDLLEQLVKVEGSGWKGRGGSSLGCRTDLMGFFQRYARRAAERRRLRISMLSFGPHLAAVELSVEAYNRMWQLKIGFNDALRSYYPGLHLTESAIRRAFQHGLKSYEFLGSAAPWQAAWAKDSQYFQTFAVYPLSAFGLWAGCLDLSRRVRRAADRRISARPQTAAQLKATIADSKRQVS